MRQATAAVGDKRPGLFRGWYVVGVALAANFLATGSGFYVFNAFMLPLCQARGWTRAELNVAPMLGYACGVISQFVFGSLMTRVGPRRLMTLGPLLGCAAFVMLGRVESLAWFYVFYVLLMVGNGAMGGLVANTLVSNWFEEKRGKAIGLATVGISLSGVILPGLAARLLETGGLEGAFLVIGLAILIISPMAWFWVRDTPEEMGLRPDGSDGGGEPFPPPGRAELDQALYWTPRRLAVSPAFWRLGTAFGLAMMGIVGVMYQLGPRFMDEGYSPEDALRLVAATALAGTIGKYLWGLFCDKAEPKSVAAWMLVANALGMALGLMMQSVWGAGAFVVLFGFTMGGVMSTYPIIAAHIFGRFSFPLVFRFLVIFLGLQALGYLVMGQSFALTGSYDPAFAVFAVLDLAAAWLLRGLPPGRAGAPPPIVAAGTAVGPHP